MIKNYFENCKTAEDVKQLFKELAKKLHPDCGGDAEAFKAMMQDYNKAFEQLKHIHTTATGETYEKDTDETPEAFAEIIEKLLNMDGVKIEIIGSWIWLTGSTMVYKEQIKSAGFWWSKTKKAWYYNGDTKHSRRKGHYSMDKLREKWGATEIDPDPRPRLV